MSEKIKIKLVDEEITEQIIEQNFIEICDKLLKDITTNYKQQRDEIRGLRKMYIRDVKNATKSDNKPTKKTGIVNQVVLPDKLAMFIGKNKGCKMSRPQLTSEVYKVIKERGLFYEGNKRVLRADAEIMTLFNLPESVNKSTDDRDSKGFNFYNISTYIKNCFDE